MYRMVSEHLSVLDALNPICLLYLREKCVSLFVSISCSYNFPFLNLEDIALMYLAPYTSMRHTSTKVKP